MIRRDCTGIAACALLLFTPASIPAQESSGTVIKTETRVVLVDAVVTDKKGEYVRGLTQKDFKVYEDNHEQAISSFSFEADPASPTNNQPRYLVLFFDNSTMDIPTQRYARTAAAKFVEANAGPKRMMAVIEYAGGIHIAQNFTDDGERLKQVVSGVKLAPRYTDANGLADAGLSRAAASFSTRNSIMALKSLVKNLANVPGRKSLVLLSGGFRLNNDTRSELTELISVCNRSNVAVYPIDARGLVAMVGAAGSSRQLYGGFRVPGMNLLMQVKGGGGGGGIGGGTRAPAPAPAPSAPSRPSTGSGGSTTTPRSPSSGVGTVPTTTPRMTIPVPPIPPSATDNQEPLYLLASGTGGFVIVNTNDLLGGMEKIGKEQNEHYLIGYSPENFEEGKCHSLKVKVTQSGMTVRARTGYCDVKPPDLLSGNATEKDLEKIIAAGAAGTMTASMQAPFFYTAADSARMNVTIEVPSSLVKFEKKKGKFHGQVNLLGMVYRADGGVAARFSDNLKFDFDDKKGVEAFQEKPILYYEKDVDGVPGTYTLKLAISSGTNFAKIEMPVSIDAYDGKKFELSAMAFSTVTRRAAQADALADAIVSEDRTPLIASGILVIPTARTAFKKTEPLALYAEMYEPALVETTEIPSNLVTRVQLRIVDAKTGEVKLDSGVMRQGGLQAGNPVVPLALKVPIDGLGQGDYVCELIGSDSSGGKRTRSAKFSIE